MKTAMMNELYQYIEYYFSEGLTTHFARDMLENILIESEKIESISERCEWLAKMIPQVRITEIREILLR